MSGVREAAGVKGKIPRREVRSCALALVAALVLAAVGRAAQRGTTDYRTIEVRISAVSHGSIYLDKGSDAGIVPGDRVYLTPLDGESIAARIRLVSARNSRVDLDEFGEGLVVGDRGVVVIPWGRPRKRAEAESARPPRPEPPEHPPWQHPLEDWDPNTPLLAPAPGRARTDRPLLVRGRAYVRALHTVDSNDSRRTYQAALTGADLSVENPFRRGGELAVSAELSARRWKLPAQADDTEELVRVERLSYEQGGMFDEPFRWQVGRFLQHELPELGLLDGIELGYRLGSGNRVGASVGFLPEMNDEMHTGDDFQAALFYRYVSDESERVSLAAGYQKTWHEGAEDRDLLVASAELRPHPRVFVSGSAWLDYYDSGDRVKRQGLELTRLLLNASYVSEEGNGVGLYASRFLWPELLRDEFLPVTAPQILDNEVSRIGVRSWRQLSDELRLSGRLEGWEDEDDSGGNGEITLALRDWLYDDGQVSLGLFHTESSFGSSSGLRSSASKRLKSGYLDLRWTISEYEQDDTLAPEGDLLHHLLRLSYDLDLWTDWSVSVFAEQRFGDEQDALSAGLYVQRRF